MNGDAGRWIVVNKEILYARDEFSTVTASDIALLKRFAAEGSGRARICLHPNSDAILHDMVIVHARGTYVRPHRHLTRAETLFVLEGEATFIRFSEDGHPIETHRLNTASAGTQIVRVPAGEFHGLLIHSDWLVFCESTLGPFDATTSEFALWSPMSTDLAGIERYLDKFTPSINAS